MKITIDKSKLKKEEVDLSELVGKISTGQAMLFTGAGFSKFAENIKGENPPAAKKLSEEICALGGFEPDEDLRFSADFYIENNDLTPLIELLKDNFTINNTDSIIDDICRVNWRRFYTTNYDKSIEFSSAKVGKRVTCIDLHHSTSAYYNKENLCIHLNGSIDSLTEESIEGAFKLSTSSYISAESFTESDWHYYFKKDLERSSAIFFVGYSMYDIEIQKILFENNDLKEKTYFITRANPDSKTSFTLSKYGTVVPIGIEGFSKLISGNSEKLLDEDNEYFLSSLALYELSYEEANIRDADVEAMIMFGHVKEASIDEAVLGEQTIPSLVVKDNLSLIKNFIEDSKNVVLYSDMGNGKSIVVSQLKSFLSANSIECYFVNDIEGDYISDIDHLSKRGKKAVVILDSYEKYLDLIQHHSLSLPSNISIIATSRTAEHERLRQKLKEIKFNYDEICLDVLNDEEVNALIDIVDNLGMWGDKAGYSRSRKATYINRNNNSQISLTLLDIFNSQQFIDRVSFELKPLMVNEEVKDTIFAIAFLEVLDLSCSNGLISEVSGSDIIYSSDLKDNLNFNNIFNLDKSEIKTKSSLFCLSLIKQHLPPSYVTSQLLKIAKRFNEFGNKDYEQQTIFLATLRFSFVERLLSDTNKKSSLKRYYEDLKVSVGWLKGDPHFWLQYGMAHITFKEYKKAQQYFDSAYSLASNKYEYSVSNIDTQQARLFLLVAMQESDGGLAYSGFSKAHSLLDKLEDDIYKYRQVQLYKDFYDACYQKLNRGNKVAFQRACQKMLKSIERAVTNNEINLSGQLPIRRAEESLVKILQLIS